MTQALVHLLEFEVTWAELKKLPEEHLATIGVLSYAVSETRALARIYLTQAHDNTGQKALDSVVNIHKFMIMRIWSSKLFEVAEFLNFKGKKGKNKPNDELLLDMSCQALCSFRLVEPRSGFEVARNIRHEATNHYSFRAAMKNINYVRSGADCNMYIHDDVGGNEFYPFGEELMLHARLSRNWENVPSKAERDQLLDQWLSWNLEANRWLFETHAVFTRKLVFDALGRNKIRPRKYWAPMAFVGDAQGRMTPLFWRKDSE